MFGRSQQLLLPQPASAFQPIDYEQAAAKLDEKFHFSCTHYDRDKVQLFPFSQGKLFLCSVIRQKSGRRTEKFWRNDLPS